MKLHYDNIVKMKPTGDKFDHLTLAYNSTELVGDILEFGVFKGGTINHLAGLHEGDVYGFDSFEGLPEGWGNVDGGFCPKGSFKTALPKVKDNVTLIKGWFDETMPVFLKEYTNIIKLLHIDCDLYSSTTTVLTLLNNYIVKNTVIVFDELANWNSESAYKDYQQHEWRALENWSQEYNRPFTIIGRSNHCQASIIID